MTVQKPPLPRGERFTVSTSGLEVTVAVTKFGVQWIDRRTFRMDPYATEKDFDRRVLDAMNTLSDVRDKASAEMPKWLKKWQ